MTARGYREQLERFAAQTQKDIEEAIVREETGPTIRRLEKKLAEIERRLEALRRTVEILVPQMVMYAVMEELQAPQQQGAHATREVPYAAITAGQEATRDLSEAVGATVLRIREATRRARYDAEIMEWLKDANSQERAQERLEELLSDKGLTHIEYRNGRMMPIGSYAQMHVRTTQAQAVNMTAIGMAEGPYGDGVVRMSWHTPTCAICAPRQGRYYRTRDFPLENERSQLPHISNAFPDWPEFDTVHPNCLHRIHSVIWAYMNGEEKQAALEGAKAPFDTDPRLLEEVEAYNDSQRENRRIRADRDQYLRYKFTLGDDAPRTFAAFRRVKKSNGARWAELQEDYRDARIYIRTTKQTTVS